MTGKRKTVVKCGPSSKKTKYEDGEDFSASSSDWLPSNEEAEDSESGAEVKGRKKHSARYKHQYSRSNSKIITSSKTASQTVSQKSTRNDKAYHNQNKLVSDSTNIDEEIYQVLRQLLFETDIIEEQFMILFQMVEDLKIAYGYRKTPLQPVVNVNDKEETVPIASTLTADDKLQDSSSQPNLSFDESKLNDNIISEDELNRSDDNVLITNKYSNVSVQKVPKNEAVQQEWVPIGSGMTLIPRNYHAKINWKSYTTATRTLLLAVFTRRILATHSLTGKPSPAFQDKPAKMRLDQRKISDVIAEVMDRFNVRENLVRSIITTKCADECKMWKTRCEKNASKKKKKTETL